MLRCKLRFAMVAVMAVGLVGAGGTLADEPAKPKDPGREKGKKDEGPRDKGKPRAQETVTLTGTVGKKDEVRKKDDGSSLTLTLYSLTEKGGNRVELPRPRYNEAGKLLDPFDLEAFVGKEVVVTGRATLVKKSELPNAPRQAARMSSITDIRLKK